MVSFIGQYSGRAVSHLSHKGEAHVVVHITEVKKKPACFSQSTWPDHRCVINILEPAERLDECPDEWIFLKSSKKTLAITRDRSKPKTTPSCLSIHHHTADYGCS